MRERFVGVGLLLVLMGCGSEASAPSTPPPADGGPGTVADSGGTPPPSAECTQSVKTGDACTIEDGCCRVNQAEGFGPEGFRCKAKTWTTDTTCLPPPPSCPAPLTGSLSRADGSSTAVTCVRGGGQNGVASIALTLDGTGEIMEIYFDRAPAVNDVLDVIVHTKGQRPDGGAANRASLQIGRPGGFAGFDVVASSASGKLTVTAIEAASATSISSLRASIDVELTGSAPWAGKLTGAW